MKISVPSPHASRPFERGLTSRTQYSLRSVRSINPDGTSPDECRPASNELSTTEQPYTDIDCSSMDTMQMLGTNCAVRRSSVRYPKQVEAV